MDTGRRWTPRVQLWGRGRVRAPVHPLASALTPAWQSPQSPWLLTTRQLPTPGSGAQKLRVRGRQVSSSRWLCGAVCSGPSPGCQGGRTSGAPGLCRVCLCVHVASSHGFPCLKSPTCLFLGFGPTVIRRAWSIASATTLFPDTVTVPILRGPALERGSPPFNLLHPLSSRRRGRWVVAGNASCRGVTHSSLSPDLGQELDLQTSAS